jgi:hypothetical protein
MPRDGTLTTTPRPLGLGSDVGRIAGAVLIGLVLAVAYWFGLPWAFEAAIRGGLGW